MPFSPMVFNYMPYIPCQAILIPRQSKRACCWQTSCGDRQAGKQWSYSVISDSNITAFWNRVRYWYSFSSFESFRRRCLSQCWQLSRACVEFLSTSISKPLNHQNFPRSLAHLRSCMSRARSNKPWYIALVRSSDWCERNDRAYINDNVLAGLLAGRPTRPARPICQNGCLVYRLQQLPWTLQVEQ